jgi:IS5 family transposase
MHPQRSFADVEYDGQPRQTRRERFLRRMEALMPWARLEARIRPVYPTGERGRPPYPLALLLRIHCVQLFYNLSDPAMEDALYDSVAVQRFVGLTARGPRPDETTILHFRHLLERHALGEVLLAEITRHLAAQGLRLREGTIVDATILDAPASTKNRAQARDPEMHQVKKGNQWYFGMKAHIGVDAQTKLIHSLATTSANVHDSQVIGELLHGEERGVWGDSAYQGQGKVIREVAPQAQDFIQQKGARYRPLSEEQRARNRTQSKVRAKVEHPFQVMKRVFGFTHVRYRGLVKNTHRVQVTCALVNLFLARKRGLGLAME